MDQPGRDYQSNGSATGVMEVTPVGGAPDPYGGFDRLPIGRHWVTGRRGTTLTDRDPWSGEVVGEVPMASSEDVAEAYRSATEAQRLWADASPQERAVVMRRAADVHIDRHDELAGWLRRESGGTVAKVEIELGVVRAGLLEAAGMPHLALPPHVLLGDNDVATAREEVFGPVITVIKAHDEDDALRLANDTEYGLSSAVHTRDLERGVRFGLRLDAGMTHVNDSPVNEEDHTAYGGEKMSGLGRFGGTWSIEEFTTHHWISVQHSRRPYPLGV